MMQTCALCPCLTRNVLCHACSTESTTIESRSTAQCRTCNRRVCLDHDGVPCQCTELVSVDDYISTDADTNVDELDANASYLDDTDDDAECDVNEDDVYDVESVDGSHRLISEVPMFRRLPSWMRERGSLDVPLGPPMYVPMYLRGEETEPPDRLYMDREVESPLTITDPVVLTSVVVDLSLRDVCAICLVNFSEAERVQQLSCHPSHLFHAACIATWMEQSPTCPMCKQ